MNKMTTRILIAASMCLSLATFNGVSASAQGKMKEKPMKMDKSMKMDKPMMKHDDDMMMEDHGMGMMMEGESPVSMMSSYPNAAPGNLNVCTYAEACAMMSGDKKMMMHDDKMMHEDGMMMHEDDMMMHEDGMSHHGYPYAAPGNMSAMPYSKMISMMHDNDKMMMMHDDKMMHEDGMMGDKKMDKPMKMKKDKMMKKM